MPQTPEQRKAIVQRMIDAGETEDNIATVIQHFEKTPETPPSALRRFGGSMASDFNPLNIISGMAQQVAHPIDSFVKPTITNLRKIPSAVSEGRYTDAANALAGAVPVLGPAAEGISEQMKAGDVAGGLGHFPAMVAGGVMMGRGVPSKVGSGLTKRAAVGIENRVFPELGTSTTTRMLERGSGRISEGSLADLTEAAAVAKRANRPTRNLKGQFQKQATPELEPAAASMEKAVMKPHSFPTLREARNAMIAPSVLSYFMGVPKLGPIIGGAQMAARQVMQPKPLSAVAQGLYSAAPAANVATGGLSTMAAKALMELFSDQPPSAP